MKKKSVVDIQLKNTKRKKMREHTRATKKQENQAQLRAHTQEI
jgi:hypothetical protein